MKEKFLTVAEELHAICKREGVILVSDAEGGIVLRNKNDNDQEFMCCVFSEKTPLDHIPVLYLDFV